MDTFVNQLVVLFKLDERVFNVPIDDHKFELTFCTQEDKVFTVLDTLQAVVLMDCDKRDTLFNQETVLEREEDTILRLAFVNQQFPLRFK